MDTPFDFICLAVFAAFVTIFLQRAVAETEDPHPLWEYLLAAVGCAVANYVGNHGSPAVSIAILIATIVYAIRVLKPFPRTGP